MTHGRVLMHLALIATVTIESRSRQNSAHDGSYLPSPRRRGGERTEESGAHAARQRRNRTAGKHPTTTIQRRTSNRAQCDAALGVGGWELEVGCSALGKFSRK